MEHQTHFYTVMEINKEEEEAIFWGLLRRDNLDAYLAQNETWRISKVIIPFLYLGSTPNPIIF